MGSRVGKAPMGKHQSTVAPDHDTRARHGSGGGGDGGYVQFGKGRAAASVVLDFDCTISQTHVWFALRKSGNGGVSPDRIPRDLSVEQVFGGRERRAQLEGVFSFLTAHGVQLVILTNNYKEVVDKCIACVGWEKYLPDVIGRERPGTKGQIVAALRESLGAGGGQWVFVDDDQSNVASVEAANRGNVKTIYVDGGVGMTDKHLRDLLASCFPDGAPPGAPCVT